MNILYRAVQTVKNNVHNILTVLVKRALTINNRIRIIVEHKAEGKVGMWKTDEMD